MIVARYLIFGYLGPQGQARRGCVLDLNLCGYKLCALARGRRLQWLRAGLGLCMGPEKPGHQP